MFKYVLKLDNVYLIATFNYSANISEARLFNSRQEARGEKTVFDKVVKVKVTVEEVK